MRIRVSPNRVVALNRTAESGAAGWVVVDIPATEHTIGIGKWLDDYQTGDWIEWVPIHSLSAFNFDDAVVRAVNKAKQEGRLS